MFFSTDLPLSFFVIHLIRLLSLYEVVRVRKFNKKQMIAVVEQAKIESQSRRSEGKREHGVEISAKSQISLTHYESNGLHAFCNVHVIKVDVLRLPGR